jgi:5'-nucleotidase
MKILLSNDDGFLAEGIRTLNDGLREIAEVKMVAPETNHSGVSNSLTLSRPLKVTEHGADIYSVNGTPTDCVHLAVTGILKELDWHPDIVVSGINEGANLSDDVIYSGTVAAATEGRFLGLPAIAVSLVGDKQRHYDTATQAVKEVLGYLEGHPMPAGVVLNLNVPDLPYSDIKGFKVTRLGTRHCAQPTIAAKDPRGSTVYWVGLPGEIQDAGPGTDFHAVDDGFVSVTPLQFDLTNYAMFDDLGKWFEKFAQTL